MFTRRGRHIRPAWEQPETITIRNAGIEMFTRKGRHTRLACEHTETITIRNAGIERTVCETCGKVSLKGVETLSATIKRSQFERASYS
ncbi:MAG TPA: hypothetical protein VE569_11095 [Acidimicrobiia bacterium]|jgi:PHP family Zn ribbon phosphoesterase|nr:hypothetical protein [Acidimicrobiia bacterium]